MVTVCRWPPFVVPTIRSPSTTDAEPVITAAPRPSWPGHVEQLAATRASHDSTGYHFLRGFSLDGATLAFVDLPRGEFSARVGLR